MFSVRGRDEGRCRTHRPRLDPALPEGHRTFSFHTGNRAGKGASPERARFRLLKKIPISQTARPWVHVVVHPFDDFIQADG